MKHFCLLMLALASLSVHAKKDECLVDLVELRAPLVEASLWGNRRLPQLDLAIVIKMASQFVAHPIPEEALRADNHVDEIARYLEEMATAHAAYGIHRPHAKPAEEIREDIERLYEVERLQTIQFLHILIEVSGRDPQESEIDDFFVKKRWPKNLAIVKRLTAVFEGYLQTDAFRALGLELREQIRARVRAGDVFHDLLEPAEDRFEKGVMDLCGQQDARLRPTLRKFWAKLRETE